MMRRIGSGAETPTRQVVLWFGLGFLTVLSAQAQPSSFQDQIRSMASQAPDLKFPMEVKELNSSSPLEMAIYKPEGRGPFPALVLFHTCGGLRPEIRDWTKEVLSRGYAVFVLDSFSQRGLKTNCVPPSRINFWRGAKDAFQALDHLARFEFIDPGRVALMGFSWGAMAGLLTDSQSVAEAFSPEKRFVAVVGFYPACYFPALGDLREIEFLRPDTDRPALVLMGELDTETPPSDCLPRLEALREKGVSVAWHVYPKTTHCWDCSSIDGFTKTFRGNAVVYHYDKSTADDSARRAFDFLDARLKPAR